MHECYDSACYLCIITLLQILNNTTTDNEMDLALLHPAAQIFSGIVLGDIGVDNERLTEEISRLQPLLEYAQKVTVEAAVNEEDPLSFDLCHHGRINATYF